MMKKSIFSALLACALFGFMAALLIFFFNLLPIEGTSLGIDWRAIWHGIRGGALSYGTGLRNPPWSLIPILPLGFLPFKTSWAILTLVTIAIEVISVPRKSSGMPDGLLTVFLSTSYPSLRNVADGNLECLSLFGALLMLIAYRRRNPWLLAVGLLLASGKPQETWLFLAVLSLYVLHTWPRKRILYAIAVISAVVAVTMTLHGRDWIAALIGIEQRGSIMDISLHACLTRLALPPAVTWGLWIGILCISLYIAFSTGTGVDHRKAGLLILASLLLSPYAAGNNLLLFIAIGIVPLFQSDKRSAIALGILINLPYLTMGRDSVWLSYGAYYMTVVLLIGWFVFAWKTWKSANTFDAGNDKNHLVKQLA